MNPIAWAMWLRAGLWAGLAAALLAGLHWWTSSIERRGQERGRAEVQALRDRDAAERAREDTARTRAALRQSEVAREEEARREAAKEKEIANAQETARVARAAAARAGRAADGLRQQLDTYVAAARAHAGAACTDPGAGQRSEAAAAPVVVLADLFGRADAVAGELAAALDHARGAGIACERSYQSLIGDAP